MLTTFQQSLTLFKQGRADEVAAGCNLLLQMDPMFDPAKKLLAKLRNPELPFDVLVEMMIVALKQKELSVEQVERVKYHLR